MRGNKRYFFFWPINNQTALKADLKGLKKFSLRHFRVGIKHTRFKHKQQ